jgi:predicted DNA-binding ribbon-helix-helix protein
MTNDDGFLPSQVKKRSIQVGHRKTSVSLEDTFWDALENIAQERGQRICELAAQIEAERGENSNLSSAIRVFVLEHAQRSRVSSA